MTGSELGPPRSCSVEAAGMSGTGGASAALRGPSQLGRRGEEGIQGDDGVVAVAGDVDAVTAVDGGLRGDVAGAVDHRGLRIFLERRGSRRVRL